MNEFLKQLGAFVTAHPYEVLATILIIWTGLAKGTSYLVILKQIKDEVWLAGLERTPPVEAQARTVNIIAQKTKLTADDVAGVVKITETGKLKVDGVALAKRIAVSGDFKKLTDKLIKWAKNI